MSSGLPLTLSFKRKSDWNAWQKVNVFERSKRRPKRRRRELRRERNSNSSFRVSRRLLLLSKLNSPLRITRKTRKRSIRNDTLHQIRAALVPLPRVRNLILPVTMIVGKNTNHRESIRVLPEEKVIIVREAETRRGGDIEADLDQC